MSGAKKTKKSRDQDKVVPHGAKINSIDFIKDIQTLLKKKKFADAKSKFILLVWSWRSERQTCPTNYPPPTKVLFELLKPIDEIYMKIGIASSSYFTSNSKEWTVVCFLGWLHAENDEREKAKTFFKKWYSLFVNGIKEKKTLPDYYYAYEDDKDNIAFLEEDGD